MVIWIFKELSENSNSIKKDIQTIKKNVRNEEYNIWGEKEIHKRNKW